MALWTYLNAYLSSIPSSQRQRLLNLLYGQVQSTQIQTVADYEAAFQAEIKQLNQDPTSPTFTLRTQQYRDVTSSANFNDMEQNAIGSLKTLYQEAVLLENAVSNHVAVVDGDLTSIEATVDDLNKQVSQLELLSTNTDGFVTSVYDSFNVDNSNRLTRTDPNANAGFFTDPVLGFIQPAFDAVIDNGALKLPINNEIDFNINAAYLENQDPPGITTLEQTAPSGFLIPTQEMQYSLADLLSPQQPNTYWAETVDVTSLTDASGNPINNAQTDLIIGIAGVQQINRITVDPFTRYPYIITDIQYMKNALSGTWVDLAGSVAFPITVESSTIIDLPVDIYADTLKIHIQQNNYSSLRYTTTGVNNTIASLYNVATGQQIEPPASLTDPNNYYYAMTSSMQTLLGISPSIVNSFNQVNVYEFMYGIQNLAISQLLYSNLGLYVSKAFRITSPGAIGLDVIQTIPNLTAVQYRVFVQYKDIVDGVETGNATLNTAILPGSVSVISDTTYPEILDGSDNDTTNIAFNGQWFGFTKFPVDLSQPISVSQNGVPMLSGSFNVDPQSDGTVRIWFFSNNNVNRNISVFTVSYTPQSSSRVASLAKHDVAYVNLQILLRSISPNRLITPFLTSYSMKFKKFGSL